MGTVTLLIRLLGSVSWIALARLLDPQDFGMVALAGLVLSTTDLFSGLGMEPAVIQSKLDYKRIAFPAFLITSGTSFILFLLAILFPSFWSGLLGNQEVIPVVQTLSVLILLGSFSMIPRALLKKSMKFRNIGIANFTSELINIGMSVGMAFLGFGFWSLVYGKIAGSLSKVAILWVSYPGWIWLSPVKLVWEDMKGLLRYGIQNTTSGFLSFFNSNWDDWLVGRMIGADALGFYSKAYDFTNRTIAGLNREAISGVMLPSYALVQDQKERLLRTYIKSLTVIALILTPISLGVLAVAGEIIPILLGEKWIPMVLTLQIFAFMAYIRPLSGSTAPLFQAVGRPNMNIRVGLVITAVMVPSIILLFDRGIEGVAVSVSLAYMVSFVFNVYQMSRILPGSAIKIIRAILPATFAGVVMMLGVHISKAPLLDLAGGQYDLLSLVLMVSIGAVLYVLTAFILRREIILEAIDLVMTVLGLRKRAPQEGQANESYKDPPGLA